MFAVRKTLVRVRCCVQRSYSERVRLCVRTCSVFGARVCCVVFGVGAGCCVVFAVRGCVVFGLRRSFLRVDGCGGLIVAIIEPGPRIVGAGSMALDLRAMILDPWPRIRAH